MDCYVVHPNYGNDIRWLYINILSRVSKSDMLQFILRQMFYGTKLENIVVHRKNPDMYKQILDSEYALS